MENVIKTINKSTKSGLATLLFGIFLGVFGAHRFYVGKIGTGLLMALTLGGLGIWLFTDLIFIISNKFEDKQGNTIVLVRNPSPLTKGFIGFGVAFCEVLVYLGFFFAIVFYFTSGLIKPIQNQLNAIRLGDMQIAYAYTSTGFQRMVSFEDFKKIISHYSSLKNNANFSWSKREFQNDKGFVRGIIKAKDGFVLPIEYRLIKEDGEWKILGFVLNPKNNEKQSEVGAEPLVHVVTEKKIDTDSPQSQLATPLQGYQVYEDKRAKFSINYPIAWDMSSKKSGHFYVTEKKERLHIILLSLFILSIQKKQEGKFPTAKAYVAYLKKQIIKKFSNVKFLKEGEAELPKNPKQFRGEHILFTFTHRNIPLKRMDFVIERNDGLAFYDWSYTAPEKLFDQDLPIAKTMYESWLIQ